MISAHGIGGAKDLPIPAEYAMAGAGAALAVSFIVLALAWRRPRYDASTQGRPLPGPVAGVLDGAVLATVLRVLGMVFTAYVVWAAVAGPDLLTNPTFGVVYVLLWVGIVPLSLLLGPFYRAVSPVRTLHLLLSRATGGRPDTGVLRLPGWVGYWPAALGLLAFVWLELVYPQSTYLSPVRLWFAAYLVTTLVGALLFGERWLAAADPFEVFSTLVGHLSVVGRTSAGTLVLRSPLANLDGVPARPGLVGVVAVLFGSTAFDSFKDSNEWLRFTQSSSVSSTWLDLAALLAFCAVVALTFSVATMATGVGPGVARRTLPGRFAHSVVPIIVGYLVAHYLSYFVEVGQQTLVQLSDPLSRGWNLLGTGGLVGVATPSPPHPTLLAVVKVLAVVSGHVLGRRRRPRPGHPAAAAAPPAHRAAAAAVRDGLLHRHRALPALRSLSRRPRPAGAPAPVTGPVTAWDSATSAERSAESPTLDQTASGHQRPVRRGPVLGQEVHVQRGDEALDHAADLPVAPAQRGAGAVDHHAGAQPGQRSRSSTSPRASRASPTGSAAPTTTTSSALSQ